MYPFNLVISVHSEDEFEFSLLVYTYILTVTTLAILFLLPLLLYHGVVEMTGYEQNFAASFGSAPYLTNRSNT